MPVTRRQALKTLAALTGAAALASVPNDWQRPQLAVGALPAKAQEGSGLMIDPGSVVVDAELAGSRDEPNTSQIANVAISFDYSNAVGGVTLMDVTADWLSSAGAEGPGGICTDHYAVDNPDGTSGHIAHTIADWYLCSCAAGLSIFIRDGSGRTSNTVTGELNVCD